MHAYDLYNCHLKFHMYVQDIKIQHAFEFWASVFIRHLSKKLEVILQSEMKMGKFSITSESPNLQKSVASMLHTVQQDYRE